MNDVPSLSSDVEIIDPGVICTGRGEALIETHGFYPVTRECVITVKVKFAHIRKTFKFKNAILECAGLGMFEQSSLFFFGRSGCKSGHCL